MFARLRRSFSCQEDGSGIYVRFPKDAGLRPGDRIEVTGATDSSFRPVIVARTVKWLSHGKMPPARQASFADLIQSRWDSQYVELDGAVQSAAMEGSGAGAKLRIRVRGGERDDRGSRCPPWIADAGRPAGREGALARGCGRRFRQPDADGRECGSMFIPRTICGFWSGPLSIHGLCRWFPPRRLFSGIATGILSRRAHIAGTLDVF